LTAFLLTNEKGETVIKIMFICHGNICRSPMAEFVFKKMIKEAGMEQDFLIASSATSTEEIWNGIGNPVYPPAKAELKVHGISCEGKRAVRLQKSDYEKYDYLVCMDSKNVRNALNILGGDPDGKVYKLLDIAGLGRDVSDPWYTGEFSACYNDIFIGCEALLKIVLAGK
jgi:protein-tyrosine phosphatase